MEQMEKVGLEGERERERDHIFCWLQGLIAWSVHVTHPTEAWADTWGEGGGGGILWK